MSLCINSHCPNPQNRDDELFCLSCGSELLLQGRYRVMHQLGGGGFGLTAEDCDIFGNGLANVAIGEASNPLVQRCQIHDGKKAGLLVYKNAKGTIENCNIFSNALSGVEIREGNTPVIRQCIINKNKYNAVYVYDQGGGKIENCDLTANVRTAFDRDKTSNIQNIGNKIDAPSPIKTP